MGIVYLSMILLSPQREPFPRCVTQSGPFPVLSFLVPVAISSRTGAFLGPRYLHLTPDSQGFLEFVTLIFACLGSLLTSRLEFCVLLLSEPSFDYEINVVSRLPGTLGTEQMSLSFPTW